MPLLSVDAIIDSDNIKTITSISPGRPVFLVVGSDNSHLVLKQEITTQAHDPVNLKFANKAMKAVSPAANSKVLTSMEVAALRSTVQLETDVAQMTFRPVPPDILYLGQVLLQGGAWFKMDKADGIIDLQRAVTKAIQNQDKSGVRQIAAALSAPNGLESLGRILAADFFNGTPIALTCRIMETAGQETRTRAAATSRFLSISKTSFLVLRTGRSRSWDSTRMRRWECFVIWTRPSR